MVGSAQAEVRGGKGRVTILGHFGSPLGYCKSPLGKLGHLYVNLGHHKNVKGHIRVTLGTFCLFQYRSHKPRNFGKIKILNQKKG